MELEEQQEGGHWKPDKAAINELQTLKKFVDFVANLADSTPKSRDDAQKINYLIENIDQPATHKNWCACLDIFDPSLESHQNEGVYNRHWSVFFEQGILSVKAETRHTSDNLGHYGSDFCYYATVDFREEIGDWDRVCMTVGIKAFVQDAEHYEKYMTPSLNEVETAFDIW